MAAAANPLATQAGQQMLRKGGSAIDAAIAMQAVLALVEPQSSGIGGGAFIMYWDGKRVQAGIDATRAAPPRAGLPVVVIHGTDDGLVPQAFSSAPYVAMARAAGRDVRYWQVRHAQHFDAFLGFPQYAATYLPLLPYVYEALDRVDAHLDGRGALPADADIPTKPRAGQPLAPVHLAMPR